MRKKCRFVMTAKPRRLSVELLKDRTLDQHAVNSSRKRHDSEVDLREKGLQVQVERFGSHKHVGDR